MGRVVHEPWPLIASKHALRIILADSRQTFSQDERTQQRNRTDETWQREIPRWCLPALDQVEWVVSSSAFLRHRPSCKIMLAILADILPPREKLLTHSISLSLSLSLILKHVADFLYVGTLRISLFDIGRSSWCYLRSTVWARRCEYFICKLWMNTRTTDDQSIISVAKELKRKIQVEMNNTMKNANFCWYILIKHHSSI